MQNLLWSIAQASLSVSDNLLQDALNVYLFVCLLLDCLFICNLFIYLLDCLFTWNLLFVCLLDCLFTWNLLFICLLDCLLEMYLFVCLIVYLKYMFIYLFIYLFVGSPKAAQILPIPPSYQLLSQLFDYRHLPNLGFVPGNYKHFISFFSQFWLLLSSKLYQNPESSILCLKHQNLLSFCCRWHFLAKSGHFPPHLTLSLMQVPHLTSTQQGLKIIPESKGGGGGYEEESISAVCCYFFNTYMYNLLYKSSYCLQKMLLFNSNTTKSF